jgi:hypothetical protein
MATELPQDFITGEEQIDLTDITPASEGFSDPSFSFPKKDYLNTSSSNQSARGLKINKVYTGGGYKSISLNLKPVQSSVYPYNQVKETVSGHIQEIDDTPGAERMLFRHRTGSGVEMRADGTVIISSVGNTVRITAKDEKVIVDGDAEMVYNGNLSLQVAGNFDVVVGGDYNVTVGGNKNDEVRGSHKQQVRKTQKTIVTEHQSNFVGGTQTETILGSANKIIKGNVKQIVEGGFDFYSGDDITMTAEDTIVMSADNTNIAANDMTVIGASGTIGGAGITHYGNTFHGSLNGVANGANVAGGLGPPGSQTITNTVQATSGIMNDYLHNSSFGIREVSIDPANSLLNSFDRTEDYGGLSNRELTISEVRSKLRDINALNNQKFVGAMIAEGKLNPAYNQQAPKKIGRTASISGTPRRGTQPLGNRADVTKRFKS